MGEVDPLRLFLTYFNISALTPRLHRAATALEFPLNKTLLAICRIQTGVVGKESYMKPGVGGGGGEASFIYMLYSVEDRTEP
jgi:hypothetical protein